MDRNWVRIDIPRFVRSWRLLEFTERLDRLVVGAADADLVAGDPLDLVGQGELVADGERAREGVVFQACDAEQAPPMMGE